MSHETDEKRYATVDSISDTIKWSAHAALGDALNRAEIGDDLFVCWMGKDNKLKWSKACNNAMAVYLMTAAIHKVTWEWAYASSLKAHSFAADKLQKPWWAEIEGSDIFVIAV